MHGLGKLAVQKGYFILAFVEKCMVLEYRLKPIVLATLQALLGHI